MLLDRMFHSGDTALEFCHFVLVDCWFMDHLDIIGVILPLVEHFLHFVYFYFLLEFLILVVLDHLPIDAAFEPFGVEVCRHLLHSLLLPLLRQNFNDQVNLLSKLRQLFFRYGLELGSPLLLALLLEFFLLLIFIASIPLLHLDKHWFRIHDLALYLTLHLPLLRLLVEQLFFVLQALLRLQLSDLLEL